MGSGMSLHLACGFLLGDSEVLWLASLHNSGLILASLLAGLQGGAPLLLDCLLGQPSSSQGE